MTANQIAIEIYAGALQKLNERGYQHAETRLHKGLEIIIARIARIEDQRTKEIVGATTCLLVAFQAVNKDMCDVLRDAITKLSAEIDH